jgi:hypothetical protein
VPPSPIFQTTASRNFFSNAVLHARQNRAPVGYQRARLSDLTSATLCDDRRGKNKSHRLDGQFRQSVYSKLAGYEDVTDAVWLSLDPVMCQIVGGRAVDAQAVLALQIGRLETETLAPAENRAALAV